MPPSYSDICAKERCDARYASTVLGVEVALDTRTGLEGKQRHELTGTGHRERPKDKRNEQAADGRGRAHSQREGDDDEQRERRRPSQTADGLPDVKA